MVGIRDDRSLRVPSAFWVRCDVREALVDRNLQQLFRLLSLATDANQTQLGLAIGMEQGRVSRVMNGHRATVSIDVYERIADGLEMPDDARVRLGIAPLSYAFTDRDSRRVPGSADQDENVNRSEFMRASGLVVAGAVAGAAPMLPLMAAATDRVSEQRCAQWLAWTLREIGVSSLPANSIPTAVASALDWWAPTSTIFRRTTDGCYEFADLCLVDHYIAERVFGSILAEQSSVFAKSQTSHEVDLLLGEFSRKHTGAVDLLRSWMESENPVLKVNSAGVLAKVGSLHEEHKVIGTLKSDGDVRNLYLTAVASRVLKISWPDAGRFVHTMAGVQDLEISTERADRAVESLANEATNVRDGGARWCSVVMLSRLAPLSPDNSRAALHSALRTERSAETLRSIGAALVGLDPVSL